jgi:hypothetical protein
MTDPADLLRGFRADVADPAPGAADRIAVRVRADAAPRRSFRRRPVRLAAIAVGAAAAATAAVALWPEDEVHDGGAPSAGTLLARAEAAVAPEQRIVALSLRVRRTHNQPNVDPGETIQWREWSLAGAGRAMLMHLFISSKPPDRPPDDEDSTVLTDRGGRVVDQRSWTPRAGGELMVGGPPQRAGDPGIPSVTNLLRLAYQHQRLRPAGRADDGAWRLRGSLYGDECNRTEVVLDPRTFIPRRLENVTIGRPVVKRGQRPCEPGDPVTGREVWTVESVRYLPATDANRRLLRIGDWPVASAVRWAGTDKRGLPKREPLERVPPVPPLDEG